MIEVKVEKKSLQSQPNLLNTIDYYQTKLHPNHRLIDVLTVGVIGVAVGMVLITAIKSCDAPPPKQVSCMECHRQLAYQDYFKRNGSRSPEEMAYAVINATPRNTKLLAAVAVIESNGNPAIRRSGYKKRHDGAYQVNAKYHGRVGHTAVEQSLQAERILNELTETLPIKKALAQYGGDSTDKYSQKILAELTRVP